MVIKGLRCSENQKEAQDSQSHQPPWAIMEDHWIALIKQTLGLLNVAIALNKCWTNWGLEVYYTALWNT